MNITDNYFDLRGCGDCVIVTIALLFVIGMLIYGFFKYAVHKDRQNLEAKKEGKE